VGDEVSVERVDTVHSRDGQMDLPTFLAIAAALPVALSGTFLINDAPVFGKRAGPHRSSHRLTEPGRVLATCSGLGRVTPFLRYRAYMTDPPRPIIGAHELRERIADPKLRIADVRWYLGEPLRGRSEYAAGHIPGAVFVDLDRDLAAAAGPGRHPLPDPTAFADRMGDLGFGDDHAIVVYDTASGMVAARLWWMLDKLGHRDVAVLDGGLTAWIDEGGDVTPFLPTHLRASLTLSTTWPDTIDRAALAERGEAFDLMDLRAAERYRGDVEPVDRVPGHIPGARNRPAAMLLDDRGCFLPPARLQVLLRSHGAGADGQPVMSCGSGVTACFGVLAARLAGMDDPLVYPGSYSDWSASGMPIAMGDEA
jgi:thiosulfate/3-mercaptopyruvate sulfurtransferase